MATKKTAKIEYITTPKVQVTLPCGDRLWFEETIASNGKRVVEIDGAVTTTLSVSPHSFPRRSDGQMTPWTKAKPRVSIRRIYKDNDFLGAVGDPENAWIRTERCSTESWLRMRKAIRDFAQSVQKILSE